MGHEYQSKENGGAAYVFTMPVPIRVSSASAFFRHGECRRVGSPSPVSGRVDPSWHGGRGPLRARRSGVPSLPATTPHHALDYDRVTGRAAPRCIEADPT